MANFQIPTPSHGEAGSLADWAESAMLVEGRNFLSRTELRDRVRDSLLLDDAQELDEQMDLLLAEVARRSGAATSFYPFIREDFLRGLARRDGVEVAPYEFLLWLSISPAFREQKRQSEVEAYFNGLVKQAMLGYLGPGVQAIETAAGSGTGPRSFRKALEELAASMNLRHGTWEEPPAARKDGGVDIVAWRPFTDGRPSFIVLLCQCTVQVEWTQKASDISPHLWMTWINFVRSPLTALAIPFDVPYGFERWTEVRSRIDVIFDRLRLSELLTARDSMGLEGIRDWCHAERAMLYL